MFTAAGQRGRSSLMRRFRKLSIGRKQQFSIYRVVCGAISAFRDLGGEVQSRAERRPASGLKELAAPR